jgi:hypothetical protein
MAKQSPVAVEAGQCGRLNRPDQRRDDHRADDDGRAVFNEPERGDQARAEGQDEIALRQRSFFRSLSA